MSDRNPYDFYATPDALCDAALAELGLPWYPRTILDAGAGAGAWGAAARRRWGTGAHIIGVELRNVERPIGHIYDEWHSGVDFLHWDQKPEHGYNLIIMNPPFTQAQAFIRHAFTLSGWKGTVAALLRMSFLGSQDRLAFWQQSPPTRLCPIVPRPSFTDEGSDNSEYAFYIWHVGAETRYPFKWIVWDKPRARGRRTDAVSPLVTQEVLL